MANELRVSSGIAYACRQCGSGGIARPEATEWKCSACGGLTAFRRCPRCQKAITFAPWLTRPEVKYWKHGACGKQSGRKHWPSARVSEFATPAQGWLELYGERIGEVFSDPARRRIDGSILSTKGVSGIATGECTVLFDREFVTVSVGKWTNRLTLDYSDLISLPITGRGDFVTTSGGGWRTGAIFPSPIWGPKGSMENAVKVMSENFVINEVLNKLTTTKQHQVETIVQLNWKSGSVTLLNKSLLPAQWASLLAPVIQRIETAHQQAAIANHAAQESAADEKECPYCAETIKAAAIKCRYCGSDLTAFNNEQA